MGLSYYYEFSAPANTLAEELEAFLREVEQLAKSLKFSPTVVLNVPFDTPERRDFARRLGGHFQFQDEGLKGIALPEEGQVTNHDPVAGECRLIPEHGVVLVLTDEKGAESCFGFFRFPKEIIDIHGRPIARTGFNGAWAFRDFVDSPESRYREIVQFFTGAGYATRVRDEFA